MFSGHANCCFHSFACMRPLSTYYINIRMSYARCILHTTRTRWSPLWSDGESIVQSDAADSWKRRRWWTLRRCVVSMVSILYLTCSGSKSLAVGLFLCLFLCYYSITTEWKSDERQVLRSDNNKMSIGRYVVYVVLRVYIYLIALYYLYTIGILGSMSMCSTV